jgi:ABC-2 type transport system ATP-binding protein
MAVAHAIQTEKLGKIYGKGFAALDGVSLQVRRGEIVGYVGRNGSGKTTTIKILSGLIKPSSGHASVNGIDVVAKPREAMRTMGALIEVPGIYDYLTPHEMLTYFGRVYRMSNDDIDRRIKETLEWVRLSEWEHKKIGTFSTGMERRLALARTVLHKPDLLILDEPVLGLDPEGIRDVRELIRQFRNQGMSVFLSSHLLSEIAEICDTVVFLSKGKVVSSDSMANIGRSVEQAVLQVKFLKPLSEEEIDRLRTVEPIRSLDVRDSTALLHYDGKPESSAAILRLLVSLDFEVVSCSVKSAVLEDYYMSVTGDEKGVN